MKAETIEPVLVQMHRENPNSRYLRAAHDGTLDDLMEAIADGADLLAYTERDGEYKDALLRASAWNKDPAVIFHLIECGVDRADRTHLEPGVLSALVTRGWMDVVSKLVSRGMDVEGELARYKMAVTPLMQAARVGRIDDVNTLLRHGASVTAKDGRGETVLHVFDGEDVLDRLLSVGADLEARSNVGRTPLMTATTSWFSERVKWLVARGAKIDVQDHAGDTLLHVATTSAANRENIAYFVSLGLSLDATNKAGETPLHVASRAGCSQNLTTLLELGADINALNGDGKRPAEVAGTPETAAMLAAWGARQAFGRVLNRSLRPKRG